ncbi:MAG TPA: Crp/Fnr family transcriptional regulator [Bradyrhizobium sp.]|nr:Crp/Fnr family transcriptional regulator [Bradyrhizobium sp.]
MTILLPQRTVEGEPHDNALFAPVLLAQNQESVKEVEAGVTIHQMGKPARHAFEVLDGEVMLTASIAPKEEIIAMIVGQGGMIGHALDGRHICTAVALTPVMVRPVDLASPQYATGLSKLLHESLRHQALLSAPGAIGRIARFLCNRTKALLTSAHRKRAFDGTATITIPLSRQHLARHLGMEAETLSRGLAELRKRKLIETPDVETIRILDLNKLGALCG